MTCQGGKRVLWNVKVMSGQSRLRNNSLVSASLFLLLQHPSSLDLFTLSLDSYCGLQGPPNLQTIHLAEHSQVLLLWAHYLRLKHLNEIPDLYLGIQGPPALPHQLFSSYH